MSEKDYYLVQFKPNCHFIAKRNLENQGFEVFLPLHKVTSRSSNRFIDRIRPIFPCYMFVFFDKKNSQWSKINNTVGVSRLIKFNDEPSVVPRNFIAGLIQRSNSEGILQPEKTFKNGDLVEILVGPFANFIATIEEIEAEKRIWILMEIMGQKGKIAVTKDHLKFAN